MKSYILLVPSFRLLVTITVLLFSFLSFAEIRYVSKTGTSIPPFTSWETASDSIQKCIDISNSGDTIYVANGVYKEKLLVKRGLSLIGSGIDSCIIDTRSFANVEFCVEIRDSCLIRNFRINVSIYDPNNGYWRGYGVDHFDVESPAYETIVENLLIENSGVGITTIGSNSIIKNNMIRNTRIGVWFAGELNDYPKVINNYISGWKCLYISHGSTPYIANNICIGPQAFSGSYSGLNEFYNNLFIVQDGLYFSTNTVFINNVITGAPIVGMQLSPVAVVKNNIIENADLVFHGNYPMTPTISYNNIWKFGTLTDNNIPTPDTTNIFEDPMFVNDTSDFHLQMYSKLIDAGDPSILDKDGTRSDIGLFGGPLGESYTYQDLAPRVPVNVSVEYDSTKLRIMWNRNTETDFAGYNVYRDTVADFTIDSTKLISIQTDTLYAQDIASGTNALFFKITSFDNQGNESQPSEQISVILSNVNNSEPVTVYNYKLYQNYPNPFNPSTKISYILKERGYVKLMIYDLQGELVRVLVNETKDRGYYEEEFNAEGLSSGIYIYRIDVISSSKGIPVFTDVRKMVLLK